MAKKYIRVDKNGRVEEVIAIPNLKKFQKSYHPDFIKLGTITDKACVAGQVFDKTAKKYVNYKEPAEKVAQRNKNAARANISELRREALDLLIQNSTDPAVKAIADKINTEKGKL